MNILIAEDENAIREVEAAYMKTAGYRVFEATTGEEALQIYQEEQIDLVLLDCNLPLKNGISVCKEIRSVSSHTPIIMVTARTEDMDELEGFSCGADDYIKKPFSPDILLARVNNLLKRNSEHVITFPHMTLDPQKNLINKNGKEIYVTVTQFNILYALAKNPHVVLTRDQILDKAYSSITLSERFDRTIDAHIKSIRKALEDDPANPLYIITIIGKGYMFNPQS